MQMLGIDVANIRINIIMKSKLTITDLDSDIAIEAAKLRCRYADLPTADAIIAATAINSSANFVLTDDKHIRQIKETKPNDMNISAKQSIFLFPDFVKKSNKELESSCVVIILQRSGVGEHLNLTFKQLGVLTNCPSFSIATRTYR